MNAALDIDQTLDWETVWTIVHDPSVFDRVCDDSWTSKPLHELKEIVRGIVDNPHNHVLLVTNDGAPVGCFICYAMGAGVFEAHTMLTSRCRGADAIQVGRMGTAYILNLPDVKKLVSFCPANMPEVYVFARYCGWHRGPDTKTKWLKNGVEYPKRVVEVTKENFICH